MINSTTINNTKTARAQYQCSKTNKIVLLCEENCYGEGTTASLALGHLVFEKIHTTTTVCVCVFVNYYYNAI